MLAWPMPVAIHENRDPGLGASRISASGRRHGVRWLLSAIQLARPAEICMDGKRVDARSAGARRYEMLHHDSVRASCEMELGQETDDVLPSGSGLELLGI